MDEDFLNAYQSLKFKENNSDCFSLAEAKRKTLSINFYSSIHFKESNHVTEFLLNEDLKEYAKIVDNKDPGQVNNYAESVLAILSNYQNDDRRNWTSRLDEFNIKEHLEKLPCTNDICCKNSEPPPDDLKQFRLAFKQFEETDASSSTDNTNFFINQNGSHKGTPYESQFTSIKNEPKNVEQVHSNNPIVPQRNTLSSTAFNTAKYGLQHFEKPQGQFNDVRNTTAASTSNQKNEDNSKVKNNYFRTARDELHVQNAKKFKNSGNTSNESSYNYGTVKKSLGTRKGGVFGKFQPPLRSKDSKDDEHSSNNMEVDEVVDERLKNIDPAMIELIKNEIMDCGSKITWNDIAGLHLAKNTIQEIVVWPMLRPDIFTGLRRPPKGILLFGPPGTGKTLIGKCIASQSNSTFFSISASSLTSKWVGDGEKMVRTLFAVAKVHQPSVVFIDEIDSLLSQRSDTEHESSRRIKTEFLVQLDGAGTGEDDRILIIGATNRPQELDEAARRRLVKRLYIPLPDEEARGQIIENLISTERHCLTQSEIKEIAKLTKGYSGADVKNLCQEASLGPIRSIAPSMIQRINPQDVRPLNVKDFETALCRIKSSVSESDLDIYLAWDKQYGCGSASTL